ncbi:MAG: LPS assembly lipoprotein LptE [Francisellaceae bacterium]
MIKKVILLLGFLPVIACAQLSNLEKEVSGEAQTRNGAIKNALIEAASELNGVNISAVQSSLASVDNRESLNDKNHQSSSAISSIYTNAITTATNGYIDGYSIVKQQKNENGWRVTLKIKTSKYDSVDERAKLKLFSISILPFIDKTRTISVNALDILQQSIQDKFTQSRKFNVVSRDKNDQLAYSKEMALILSQKASSVQKVRFGQQIGADFILNGDITYVDIKQTHKDFYGTKFNSWNAVITLNYRVIEAATMAIKWSNTLTITLPQSLIKKTTEDNRVDQIESLLLARAAKTVADQIIDLIYPLTVLTVQDSNVYFNEGGEQVKKGQRYAIKSAAKIFVDPSTGIHIPIDGETLATVEITEVMPKYSVGKMITGDSSSIKAGLQAYMIN